MELANASDPLIGKKIGGAYVLTRFLGKGSMGRVYAAHHGKLGSTFAVKVLHGSYQCDPRIVSRFAREATAASAIKHPNVVSVYDFIKEDDGTVCIVMEMIQGTSLEEWAKHRAIPVDAAVGMVTDILGAVEAAHAEGVVHRDLRPSNVLLEEVVGRPWPVVKITDFGLAKLEQSMSGRTNTVELMSGSPEYMSPEQCRGEEPGRASDLYSVSCILYRLLANRPVFFAESAAGLVQKHISETPVPPSMYSAAVPRGLDGAVLKALEKDPAKRYASAKEFRETLGEIARTTTLPGTSSRPPPGPTTDLISVEWDEEDEGENTDIVALHRAAPRRRRRRLGWATTLLLFFAFTAVGLLGAIGATRLFGSSMFQGGGNGSLENGSNSAASSIDTPRSETPSDLFEGEQIVASRSAPPDGRQQDVLVDTTVTPLDQGVPSEEGADPFPPEWEETPDLGNPEIVEPLSPTMTPALARNPARGRRPRTPGRVTPMVEAASEEPVVTNPPEAVETPSVPESPSEVPAATEPQVTQQPPPSVDPTPVPEEPPPATPAPVLDARVAIAGLSTRGSLSSSMVRRAVQRSVGAFRACYQRHARAAGRDGYGAVSVQLTIDDLGRARGAQAGAASLPGLSGCVQQAASSVRSSRRPDVGTVRANFSVVFSRP